MSIVSNMNPIKSSLTLSYIVWCTFLFGAHKLPKVQTVTRMILITNTTFHLSAVLTNDWFGSLSSFLLGRFWHPFSRLYHFLFPRFGSVLVAWCLGSICFHFLDHISFVTCVTTRAERLWLTARFSFLGVAINLDLAQATDIVTTSKQRQL